MNYNGFVIKRKHFMYTGERFIVCKYYREINVCSSIQEAKEYIDKITNKKI